jgi:cysteine desulfurase
VAGRLAPDTFKYAFTAKQIAALGRGVPGIVLVGEEAERLPNTLYILFPNVSGRRLLEQCPGVLASTGSACHADREDPSAILTALGISADAALGTVRLSLGRGTTRDDIETAAADLAAAWRDLTARAAASV